MTLTDSDGRVTTAEVQGDGSIKTTFPDGTVSTSSNGVDSTTYDDGVTQKNYPYGSSVSMKSDGTVIDFHVGMNPYEFHGRGYEMPTGTTAPTAKRINMGQGVGLSIDGTVFELFTETSSMDYDTADAKLTYPYPQGSIEVAQDCSASDHQTNGNVISMTTAGVITGVNPNSQPLDPTKIFTPLKFEGTNGSNIMIMLPGGTQLECNPDGTKTIRTFGEIRTMKMTGEYEGTYKNSKQRDVVAVDGKYTMTDPEGKQTEFMPNGDITIVGKNVTVTVTDGNRVFTDTNADVVITETPDGIELVYSDGAKFVQTPNGDKYVHTDGVETTREQADTNQGNITIDTTSPTSPPSTGPA
jgi:hypothetical protein